MDDGTVEKSLEQEAAKKTDKRKSKTKIASNSHVIRRRTPFRLPKRKKDVYVSNKTDFKAYIKLCEKILDSDAKEVIIHGLGGAINRACNLALHLQQIHHGTLELDIKTSSVDLIDDLEPKNDDGDYEVNERQNSAIHIRVFPIALIGALRFAK